MTKLYQHTFATGLVLELKVKFDKDRITFLKSHALITQDEAAEYEIWRNEVVVPDFLDCLTKEQLYAMARRGLAQLS